MATQARYADQFFNFARFSGRNAPTFCCLIAVTLTLSQTDIHLTYP